MSEHTAGEQGVENDALVVRRARAHVPYGPKHLSADEADADYLRAAVSNIEFSRCMGSNLTATVAAILNDLADQIDRRVTPPAVPAAPDADDASEGRGDAHHPGPIHYVGPNNKTLPVTGPLAAAIARVASAAATKARAEALREAADEWGGTERVQLDTVAKWLRARADSLAPDTAGGDR